MSRLKTGFTNRLPGILYLLLAVTGFFTRFAMDSFSIQDSPFRWFGFLMKNQSLYTSGIISFYTMNSIWLLARGYI